MVCIRKYGKLLAMTLILSDISTPWQCQTILEKPWDARGSQRVGLEIVLESWEDWVNTMVWMEHCIRKLGQV